MNAENKKGEKVEAKIQKKNEAMTWKNNERRKRLRL